MRTISQKSMEGLKMQGLAYMRAGLMNKAYPYLTMLSEQWGLVCVRCIDAVNAAQKFAIGCSLSLVERRSLPTYVSDIAGHKNQRRHPNWRPRLRPLWSYPGWEPGLDEVEFLLQADPERVRRSNEPKLKQFRNDALFRQLRESMVLKENNNEALSEEDWDDLMREYEQKKER